ncbi:uncharacterized protein B0J16DRAFT_368965 [Fusarium flagelliforme]|uniref:uncharacterized protein n=1 Tax=Fusarium flagelliforme TaxID=2675880 RepID=UPI001E8D1E34|nr:uncharacterized protein B0J16DRAFT_368965 [Fusarium flagelliforme]KAH7192766.1 hypothetical protein B0J16DRAFT_368965 [Fusarium flagelliforme]
MSSPVSHHEDASLALSPTSTNASSLDHEPPRQRPSKRILSCVCCQQRKKKCDKKTPCSNCVRLNTVCTPSQPATPRKRRRPNQELLERLSRCEELLRHCTCARLATPPKETVNQEQPPPQSHHGAGDKKTLGDMMSPRGAD